MRRRGEQRTRNQVVGSTLAVAALVAGAIGIGAGSTGGSDKVDRAADQGPTARVPAVRRRSPSTLAADPFLRR